MGLPFFRTFTIIILMAIVAGCTSSQNNAVAPVLDPQNLNISQQSQDSKTTSRYLWGYWECAISEDRAAITIQPFRTAEMHLNVVGMMQKLCSNCLQISNFEIISPGEVSLDLTLRHPVDDNTNLTGFDVRAIFIGDGDYLFPSENRLFAWGNTVPRLINYDGYTSLYNQAEYPEYLPGPEALHYIPGNFAFGTDYAATLCPFIAFAKVPPRRMFLPWYEETLNIHLELPGGPLKFGYAVDASWAYVPFEVTSPAVEFPPEANCGEAYQMSVNIGSGIGEVAGSYAELTIEVFDHQVDSISSVAVEAPDLFEGQNVLEFDQMSGFETWTYKTEIFNNLGAIPGIYPMLVIVEDKYIDPNLGKVMGYQIYHLIVPEEADPIAQVDADPNPQAVCEDIAFTGASSIDPDGGSINLYEWDWENDGIYDEEGEIVLHSWDTIGNKYIQLRVTDDEGMSSELKLPFQVTIENVLPTALASASTYVTDVCIPIEFVGTDSHDNDCGDGNIDTWDWDWNNDGIYEDTGEIIEHSFPETGVHEVQLRVTDNEGGQAILNEPLEITINNVYPTAVAEASKYTVYVDEIIEFDGSGSYDNDCGGNEIVQWDWDWENDWLFDNEGEILTHYYGGQGTGEVQLRVFDNEGDYDLLNTPLEITVVSDPNDHGWVRTWGSDSNEFEDIGYSLVIDNSNNVYAAGRFKGIVDFDQGPASDVHSSAGEEDAFLCKYAPDGYYIWGRAWGGTSEEFIPRIEQDEIGNIYVTSKFINTIDFDPGPGVEFITSMSGYDSYVVKYSPEGEFLWVKQIRGATDNMAQDIAVDSNGRLYIVGTFFGSADFDPGTGTAILTSSSYSDAFLCVWDLDGNYIEAKMWGGTHYDEANGVDLDIFGNVYVTGQFYGTVDFNPSTTGTNNVSSVNWYDMYLSKFDNAGNFTWVTSKNYGLYDVGNYVEVYGAGPAYVIGDADENDIFIARISESGNILQVREYGVMGEFDSAYGLCTDLSGNLYVTGWFSGTTDLNPTGGVDSFTAVGGYDIFITKFDSSTEYLWTITYGSANHDVGKGVVTDIGGNLVATGGFKGILDFEPGPGTTNRISYGQYDIYLLKLTSSGTW